MKLRAVCSHEDEFSSGQSPMEIAADEFRDSHHPSWSPHCQQYTFLFLYFFVFLAKHILSLGMRLCYAGEISYQHSMVSARCIKRLLCSHQTEPFYTTLTPTGNRSVCLCVSLCLTCTQTQNTRSLSLVSPSPQPSTFSLHHFGDVQHRAVTLQKNRGQIDIEGKTEERKRWCGVKGLLWKKCWSDEQQKGRETMSEWIYFQWKNKSNYILEKVVIATINPIKPNVSCIFVHLLIIIVLCCIMF